MNHNLLKAQYAVRGELYNKAVEMAAAGKEIIYTKADWVATVTINRPHNYNAYSTGALRELAAAFQDAAFDDSVSVIVFTGAGHDAFCTGGDVKEYEALYTERPRDYWKYMRLFRGYIESIVNCVLYPWQDNSLRKADCFIDTGSEKIPDESVFEGSVAPDFGYQRQL